MSAGIPGVPDRSPRFDDDLIGLDPDDPEARAFAAHLDKMERVTTCTVEGYLQSVGDFADSANRAEGARRLAAVLVVSALLLGAAWIIWDVLVLVLTTWI
ncbi:hypothetical protein EV383_2146 [Pseudonocardia sediminis]|uniref:Uncharacterized protein n=1 Tax=Pseudonocardia sediminis TaxID=1397368 RepID=A0A4Q7UTX0_PSEST|nr:hypothetical protein [Pseudonocardia sediminis]RZT85282.1 hypothetical protein EV383_2146 [Pseudonocardia sediminis]